LVLSLLPPPGPQQNGMQPNQATPPTSPRQELRALTRKWDQAMVRKDVDFLDEVLAQDYSFAHTPRSYYLAQLKTPGVEYSYHERTINEIRAYGDASLVFSHISVKGKFPGVDWFWSDFNSMDVW